MLKLQITSKKKVTLVLAYGLGLLALACSIIRLRNIVHFNGEGDFTYVASMVPVWGAVECNAGIVCASFPFILPLIKWMSGSVVASASGSCPNPISGAGHELRRTDKKSWQMNSTRLSDWHRMPSESTENIRNDHEFVFESPEETMRSDKEHVGKLVEQRELQKDEERDLYLG
ncbi:uncharacterized protein ALTATR162_LOCUS7032 [Alternaria atra]|uniref:Rhodopsin domain-containing protein n=1 Tax=Alternaria atra TaxID=119953 RepID=A0A8J2N790_9PLEO|nr:uncharacterized protein ALTATR162_LOCUS7032 [Alternaria atra]CAG5169356.1 unnamed protein product [Alternaria atra]